MKRILYITGIFVVLACPFDSEVQGQRFGGAGGGRGAGGFQPAAARPAVTPSFNRPAGFNPGAGQRPSSNPSFSPQGIVPHPSAGVGNLRPAAPVQRPSVGQSPQPGQLPAVKPGGQRLEIIRPGPLPAERPTIRPPGSTPPTTLPAQRPVGNRTPGTLPAQKPANRPPGSAPPTTLPAQRPNINPPINVNRPNVTVGNRQISNQFNAAHWSHYNRHWAVAYRPAWVRPGNWFRPWYAGRPVWYWSQPWYWYHWRWHYGYWVYWSLPGALWLNADSGALLSPADTIVYNNFYYAPPADTTVEAPIPIDYSNPLPPPGGDEAAIAYPPNPGTEGEELPTSEPPLPPTDDPAVSAANELFDAARKAFKDGDYVRAQQLVEKAIQSLPSDAALHEFRALTLFAQKKYKEEEATLYAVLSAGPGWDRKTMAHLYPDWDTYTSQLRDLETYVKDHPDEGSAHFLLAYHYLVLGSKDKAVAQLKDVVRLVPKDQLSAALLKALTQPDTPSAASAQPGPTPE